MEIIEGTTLSNKCDYSFGDHMGANSFPRPKGGFAKEANQSNTEFISKCKEYEGRIMTLFIDNIRLYNRPILVNVKDVAYATNILQRNDLLYLCSLLPRNNFVIFCSHEDTPIDSHIKIPDNVLGIHAVNAEFFGGKVHPFPYGLQRQFEGIDDRLAIMKEMVEKDEHKEPTKLLYINCGIERNEERKPLLQFDGLPWTTCRFDKDSKFFPYERYGEFLAEIKNHKFMICPQGHGMDCHRNWESLYLRRVPVMRDHPYFRQLMQGFPVLFVDKWINVSEELLIRNNHLYQEALQMPLKKLDLSLIFDSIVKSYMV